jgi:hypothetical protein
VEEARKVRVSCLLFVLRCALPNAVHLIHQVLWEQSLFRSVCVPAILTVICWHSCVALAGRQQLHALDLDKQHSLAPYNNAGIAGFEAGLGEVREVVAITCFCFWNLMSTVL